MPKALNLTDMLWQKTEGNAADRAKDGMERKAASQAAARRNQAAPADLFPEKPAARQDAPKPSTVKSFHERVQESRDRMGGKDHGFFKTPGNRMAKAADKAARDASRAESPEAPDARRAETPASHGADRMGKVRRTEGRKDSEAVKEPAQGWTPGESRPIELDAAKADAASEAASSEGWDEGSDPAAQDYDALKARLEELGIEATPEQLRDPAFLAEMLWMIDGIPMGLPPDAAALTALAVLTEDDGAAIPSATGNLAVTLPADAETASDALPGTGNATLASLLPGTAAEDAEAPVAPSSQAAPIASEEFDWTAVTEPEREEIAALLRGKLGEIAGRAELAGGPAVSDAATALPGRPALADIVAREKPLSKADLVLSDPDRLRVLQGQALAADAVPSSNALRVDIDAEIPDSPEGDLDFQSPAHASKEENSASGRKENLTDLFGRQGGQQASSESPIRENGASREAAPAFQSGLEQARATEARLAAARPQAPLHQAHVATEQAVLAQLSRKFSALGANSNGEIRLQLEPEHLGRVRISLERGEGGMNARIAVENDAVRQIVDSNIASLRQGLEDQGIKLQGLEVSVEHRHASLFNPDGSNAQEFFRRPGNGGSADGAAGKDESASESETGRRLGYNTMEYIA